MKLIFEKWDSCLEEKLAAIKSLKIISPSLSMVTLELVAKYNLIADTELITRYSLYDFFVKLSDLQAIKYGLKHNMKVYGLKNLHSKIYIFDDKEVLITSANFTYGGIYRNLECGILTHDNAIASEVLNYFNQLKTCAKEALKTEQCDKWEMELSNFQVDMITPHMMPDYGEEASRIFE
jgi:phosphatidylserine/phosphatidylglycerophosphate/cardiolipin synthase-like enzyme